MLIELLSMSNYVHFNIKLAHILGLEAAVYLNEIMSINEKALRKNKIQDENTILLNREYIESRTTIHPDKQKELQETLMKLGILESLPRNKVNLNITALTSILAAPDEELTKALNKVIPNEEPSSKNVKLSAKESKELAMQEALKGSIVTTNEELRAAYFEWIEGCFAKDGWMTKKAVITAQQMIDEFSQRNLDVALEVLRIAATNAYRDMKWAIASYQKNYNISYQITTNNPVENTVEEIPHKRPQLGTEVF
jgi:hypothetical protein